MTRCGCTICGAEAGTPFRAGGFDVRGGLEVVALEDGGLVSGPGQKERGEQARGASSEWRCPRRFPTALSMKSTSG